MQFKYKFVFIQLHFNGVTLILKEGLFCYYYHLPVFIGK